MQMIISLQTFISIVSTVSWEEPLNASLEQWVITNMSHNLFLERNVVLVAIFLI